jgi:hypothetical protein
MKVGLGVRRSDKQGGVAWPGAGRDRVPAIRRSRSPARNRTRRSVIPTCRPVRGARGRAPSPIQGVENQLIYP